jgi:hypothetical protein
MFPGRVWPPSSEWKISSLGKTLAATSSLLTFLARWFFPPRRLRRHVPSEGRFLRGANGATSKKTVLFVNSSVLLVCYVTTNRGHGLLSNSASAFIGNSNVLSLIPASGFAKISIRFSSPVSEKQYAHTFWKEGGTNDPLNPIVFPPLRYTHTHTHTHIYIYIYNWPPVWSSCQGSWLQTQRYRVPFLALPNFLISSGSGSGSTQLREDNWEATWMRK